MIERRRKGPRARATLRPTCGGRKAPSRRLARRTQSVRQNEKDAVITHHSPHKIHIKRRNNLKNGAPNTADREIVSRRRAEQKYIYKLLFEWYNLKWTLFLLFRFVDNFSACRFFLPRRVAFFRSNARPSAGRCVCRWRADALSAWICRSLPLLRFLSALLPTTIDSRAPVLMCTLLSQTIPNLIARNSTRLYSFSVSLLAFCMLDCSGNYLVESQK